MTNDSELVIFFLQTILYRDDLEKSLFQKLRSQANSFLSEDSIHNIYGKNVSYDLVQKTILILNNFNIIRKYENTYKVNPERLEYFISLVDVAKVSRDYHWPPHTFTPCLYVSPSTIITESLSGDIDDISSLLINLVSESKNEILVMSPFTNREGLSSILSPLSVTDNLIKLSIYLTAKEIERNMFFTQITDLVPLRLQNDLKVYFNTDITEAKLPHAKILISDFKKGYLGSANFTRQGLKSRFEVGVQLNEEQCKAIFKLLKVLVDSNIYSLFKRT